MNEVILTVGNVGSGKSTWSRELCDINKYIYLNADTLRGIITGDESDQTANGQVFRNLKLFFLYLLKTKHNILIDNLNYNQSNRRFWIENAKLNDYLVRAVVFRTPVGVCWARNAARERIVPRDVLEKVINNWEEPTTKEGFDSIQEIEYKEENERIILQTP